jgi:hypothetical protein
MAEDTSGRGADGGIISIGIRMVEILSVLVAISMKETRTCKLNETVWSNVV